MVSSERASTVTVEDDGAVRRTWNMSFRMPLSPSRIEASSILKAGEGSITGTSPARSITLASERAGDMAEPRATANMVAGNRACHARQKPFRVGVGSRIVTPGRE